MSTQKSTRKMFSSLLATATAALVVASGMALAPSAAFADAPTASAATGTATVASASVTGIGLDVAVAGITDPVTTYPNGVHVGVVTRGSADGAVQSDFIGATASIGRGGTMPVDGTATASIAVPAAQLDRTKQYEAVVWPQRSNPTAANIVTVLDVDVTEGQWDAVFPPVEPEAPATTLVASVSSASSAGLSVKADLTNVVSATGAYVSLIEAGTSADLSAENLGAATEWMKANQFVDGAGSITLKALPAKLDRTKSYEVISWKAHSLPTAETIFNVTPLKVMAAQWDAVFPPVEPEAPATTLVASVSSASSAGLSVKADLTNVVSATGAYVSLIEAGTSADLSAENLGAATEWMKASQFVDGAGSITLKALPAKLDRKKSYEVISWKAHSLPTAETIFNVTPLKVMAAQWDAVFPPVEPEAPATTLVASVSSASSAGLSVKADLTNVVSATGAYVSLIEAGTAGALTAENLGAATEWMKANQFVDGAGSITLKALPAKLDRKKSYEVISWKAHSLPTAETIFNVIPLKVTAAQWDAVFKTDDTKPEPQPEPKVPFTDVKKGDKFFKEISWMYTSKLSTGVKQQDGSVKYQPKANVTREAMAAFLYRLNVDKNYKEPKASKFSDVKRGDKFYKEITWMGEMGYSTGVKQADGSRAYAPKSSITREAMAAFMYRIDESKKAKTPTASPFIDVNVGDKFYKEIAWMSQSGLSTGINQGNGKKGYAPKANVTREAMAAFLFRAEK